jgi:hypothetical protein
LNETKLTSPVYLDNYWSHQTLLQRNGGTWTAATNKVNMTLVKALGTYLCWTRVTTGKHVVQLLNCYLEPGEEQFKAERAKRVTDGSRPVLKPPPDFITSKSTDQRTQERHILSGYSPE